MVPSALLETFPVRRYRTEIVIPSDRYVGLQLPTDLPPGRAVLTIHVEDAEPSEDVEAPLDTGDDIEWWEEFGGDADSDEAWALRVRLNALEV